MERLQPPIDSCLMDDHFSAMDHGLILSNNGSFRFSEVEEPTTFLQMLQRVEPTTFLPFGSEPNIIESLLQIQTLEPESCLTLETTTPDQYNSFKLGSITSPPPLPVTTANVVVKERRKRKRTRAPKNIDEVESQRMTHIAVERNRRRQMNEHLNSLRSLMPQSYLQRGDQASVVGGAIDFIKELEQLLHSLEAEKRIKTGDYGNEEKAKTVSPRACNSSSVSSVSTSEEGCSAAEGIETTVIQNHVNLKVRCKRREGQILNAIVLLEEFKLTVLHLNVTSSSDFVFFSFNLKMEDDCKLGSADEITAAVHQVFKHINGG